MAKTFNELARSLKDLIKDLNSDAHNSRSFREEQYNNLKISMDPAKDSRPHVIITIGISEASYSLATKQKIGGSLGPNDKYVQRWFNKTGILDALKNIWRDLLRKQKEKEEQTQNAKK